MWALSYLDEKQVDEFLKWCLTHTEFLVLIEPTQNIDPKHEEMIDKN